MALGQKRSVSKFLTQFSWILLLVFQESNLVICDGLDDDSLKKALLAIERRQKDLESQDTDYHGQPENIGYGFQKTLGFFDNAGPAPELGSFDSDPKNDNDLQNLLLGYEYDNKYDKRKSNFRERMSGLKKNYLISDRDDTEEYPLTEGEYLATLRNLWSNYRQSRPDDINLEDLTDAQVQEILSPLFEREDVNEYSEPNVESFQVIPVRRRKNYRVFDKFDDKKKLYPSFGEGFYGKRNQHHQNINYDNPENDFLYSLKYANPEYNREGIENLRDGGEVLGDEKDGDIMRVLKAAMDRGQFGENEPYWLKEENVDDEDTWLRGPVNLPDEEVLGRNEKRAELIPRHFKNHNGIHINAKRFPVKRSTNGVRKEPNNEKVTKELNDIFSTQESTTVLPKKSTTKKPTEVLKKNSTKPEVTKHSTGKKVVRRSDKYTKEVVYPASTNAEIAEIFRKSKKSIDWSKYFGIDKRSEADWLKKDNLGRAEGYLMARKSKRISFDRGNVNFSDKSQNGGQRLMNKRYSYDIGTNIDKVENKIADIEEKIIDDAVKFTGANSGTGKEDVGKVKNKVIKHLEAAYSLEKMKNALEEFKNIIKPEETPKKSSTEAPKEETRTNGPKESPNLEKPLADKKPMTEASKRVSTKKEGVKEIFGVEPSDSLEFLNDNYQAGRYDNEACPVLDKILNNCLRIEEMGGRYEEALIPLCSLQQICYFCGAEIGFSKMSSCDNIYLTEAQNICQSDSGCLVSARNSLLALQDLYEQELNTENGRRLLSGSCLANPCVQKYFLSSPGAIYPLEVQK